MPENFPQNLKNALARWPSGVAVVAVRREGEIRGMTASSFTSVSLEPALVLVSVDKKANLLPWIKRERRFTINLLAEGQEEVSAHFAGKSGINGPFFSATGDPLLKDAHASLVCTLWKLYPGGDHRIVVGKVQELRIGKPGKPLVYWNRGYRRIS